MNLGSNLKTVTPTIITYHFSCLFLMVVSPALIVLCYKNHVDNKLPSASPKISSLFAMVTILLQRGGKNPSICPVNFLKVVTMVSDVQNVKLIFVVCMKSFINIFYYK